MAGTLYFITLLIIIIVYMVKLIKNNKYFNRFMLLSTNIISVLSTGLYAFLLIQNIDDYKLLGVVYFLISALAFIIFVTFLVINIVILLCTKKNVEKIDDDKKLEQKKKGFIYTSIIIIIYIVITLLEQVPFYIEKKQDEKRYEEANKYVIDILNEKYGNGNFKIVTSSEKNVCTSCSWMSDGKDGYEFTIDTSFMESDFVISLLKDDFEIYTDKFLNVYYKEKNNITVLEDYIIDYKKNIINDIIKKDFNAEIKFNNYSLENIENIKFGNIPTIDELTKYVTLEDPKFDINEKNIKTKEELESYLLKLTKFFIQDLNYKDNFKYTQTSEYFRYKFDYSQIGIEDYKDQFNGYGGYVLAGIIKFDDNLGHYVTLEKDKIVRINIDSNVKEYNLEDILK